MILSTEVHGRPVRFDTTKPLDISTSLIGSQECVNAFFTDHPRFEPLQAGGFTGSVALGGPCNCENLFLNAHGNGTHTECIGHITKERITINQCLKEFLFGAELITVMPARDNEDEVIYREQLLEKISHPGKAKALVIRTLPNQENKTGKHWSGTNPPYIDAGAMRHIVETGYEHLLIDLPSVDREEDGGKLMAHHVFWNYPEKPRKHCTITEMIYVSNDIPDGYYLLNLQIASFESDASPSKPVLYSLIQA